MAYLAGPYRTLMEAEKEAGVIVGHSVYAANPRSPDEANVYLTVVYAKTSRLT